MDAHQATRQWDFALKNNDEEVSGYQLAEAWNCTVRLTTPEAAVSAARYTVDISCVRTPTGARYEKPLGSDFSSVEQAYGVAIGYYMGIRQHPDYVRLENLGFTRTQ